MTIWGKIVGGAAGFALGGPLGALLGGLAGHAVDMFRDSVSSQVAERPSGADDAAQEAADAQADDATRSIAFTIGVIVLGAKMAKVDGVVTRDEIAAFREVFRVPPEEVKNVGRIFNQARRDARGFEPYARQLGRMFRDRPQVLEQLMRGLFHIARADGALDEAELGYLQGVALALGFDQTQWEQLRNAETGSPLQDPYAVLGVPRSADDATIRTTWRRLAVENHPDRLIAQGLPEEAVSLANEKLARINQAYDTIRRERGLS